LEPTSANTKPIQELLEKQVVKILLRIRLLIQNSTGIARGALSINKK
jgi:hypothetical protein